MNETSWIELVEQFSSGWTWVIYIVAIIVAVLVVNTILRRALNVITKHMDGSRHIWRDAFAGAISPPLRAVMWVIGLTVLVDLLTRSGDLTTLSETFSPARNVVAIAIVAWYLLRVVGRSERNVLARTQSGGREVDATAADAIGKLLRASIFIVAVLAIMQGLGFSISAILAFGGVVGIAIGFAAQGIVANLFGGITVYASRPFKVGEGIISPARI